MSNEKSKSWIGKHGFIFLSGLLIVAAAIILLVSWMKLPSEVPWYYSLPWGEGQLIGRFWFASTLPLMGTIVLINLFISTRIGRDDRIAALVVEGATLLLVIIFLASFFRVISIMI
jgi:hypothetical protein